jgi:mannitol-1-/sugar-/sorbitol-6-phosphatase
VDYEGRSRDRGRGGLRGERTPPRSVLFDVDGTLLDVMPNLRRVWAEWAARHALDPEFVWQTALVTCPTETFGIVAPSLDVASCLAALHEIEDEDARCSDYGAFDGASELLNTLHPSAWALVTGNYAHRVRIRFSRLGLPLPQVIVDAEAVARGKPHPEGYLKAARALGRHPEECLVLEDGHSGITAARAAGMEVWAVNINPRLTERVTADRVFPNLSLATTDVLDWLSVAKR